MVIVLHYHHPSFRFMMDSPPRFMRHGTTWYLYVVVPLDELAGLHERYVLNGVCHPQMPWLKARRIIDIIGQGEPFEGRYAEYEAIIEMG